MEDPSLPKTIHQEISRLDGESFAGLPLLLSANSAQLESFERWAKSALWHRFHEEHYDWWSFPVDEPSLRFGAAFRLSAADVSALTADQNFRERLDRAAELVAASLGWNLREESLDERPEEARLYDEATFGNHGVRLRKMLLAAELFGREATLRSLSAFARMLFRAGRLEAPNFFDRYLSD